MILSIPIMMIGNKAIAPVNEVFVPTPIMQRERAYEMDNARTNQSNVIKKRIIDELGISRKPITKLSFLFCSLLAGLIFSGFIKSFLYIRKRLIKEPARPILIIYRIFNVPIMQSLGKSRIRRHDKIHTICNRNNEK